MVYGKRKKTQRFMEKIFSIYTKFFFGISDPLCGLKGYNLAVCKKYGLLKKKNNIGSKVLLDCKKNKLKILELNISTNLRKDNPRFGGILNGNIKILKTLIEIVLKDFIDLIVSKKNFNYE